MINRRKLNSYQSIFVLMSIGSLLISITGCNSAPSTRDNISRVLTEFMNIMSEGDVTQASEYVSEAGSMSATVLGALYQADMEAFMDFRELTIQEIRSGSVVFGTPPKELDVTVVKVTMEYTDGRQTNAIFIMRNEASKWRILYLEFD